MTKNPKALRLIFVLLGVIIILSGIFSLVEGNLRTENESLENRLQDLKLIGREIDLLKARVKEAEGSLEAIGLSAASGVREARRVENRFAASLEEADISSLRSKVEAVERLFVDENEAVKEKLKKRVGKLETTFSDIEKELERVEGSVVATAQQIEGLDERLTILEETITTLKTPTDDTVSNKIDDLEARLEALENPEKSGRQRKKRN